MLGRRVLGTAVAFAAALLLVACVPSPAPPTPTPTQLTEAEAYAAAEDAFRAYIDALNRIDVSDPETFEPAFALTTGRLNSADREKFSAWHAEGWTESGDFSVQSVSGKSFTDGLAELEVCLDSSQVQIVNADGISQVEPGRADVAAVVVSVSQGDGSGEWRASRIVRDEDASCEG